MHAAKKALPSHSNNPGVQILTTISPTAASFVNMFMLHKVLAPNISALDTSGKKTAKKIPAKKIFSTVRRDKQCIKLKKNSCIFPANSN